MKKIKIAIIALMALVAYSCEYYEPAAPDLSDPVGPFVELSSTSAQTVPEGGNINVSVTTREAIFEEYTVNYTVTGDFEASGSATVPAGDAIYTFQVPVDAGIVTDDPLSATVTLTGVSDGVVLSRTGAEQTFDVSITKFVPFVQADYATTFMCNEPGYGDYSCEFVATDDPLVLTNLNFWDSGIPLDYTFSGDFDQTIVIEEQVAGDLTIVGSGTYDGVTQTMVVDYTIFVGGEVYEENTHTFTLPAK